jgi:ATP-dependent RNA helicase DeaD
MDAKAEAKEIAGFETLGLTPALLDVIEKEGFKVPSSIQKDVIPLILAGKDVIGQAQTGTGKTAAFGLPVLQMIKNTGHVEVLVITPTRELASQVSDELLRFGKYSKIKVATIYGGSSFSKQIDAVRHGAQVIVATPGRLLDLLGSKKLGQFCPATVIVDEADEMLKMGFLEDIRAIFEYLPRTRQTLLFSATMPFAIQDLAKSVLQEPVFVKVAASKTTNNDIVQTYCLIHDNERDQAIVRIFEGNEISKSIIFCKTKKEVDRLSYVLGQRGYLAKGLHGDMEQPQREAVIENFREGTISTLIATDVAARGLNILDVSHVINYHLPFDAENYVHRVGRTGRAGRKGKAISLVTPRELQKLLRYQRFVGAKIEQGTLPSKQDIRKIQVNKIIDQLTKHTSTADCRAIVETLKEKMDLESVSVKLLSILLSQNPIDGPDLIGASENSPRGERGRSPERTKSFQRPREGQRFFREGPRRFDKGAGFGEKRQKRDRSFV